MIYPYKKLLRLPSGGIEYSEYVEVSPFCNSLFYAFQDDSISKNETEFMCSVLKEYISLNPYELYYADLIYVWQYLINQAFTITELERELSCKKCSTSQNVVVPMGKIRIKFLNKEEPKIKSIKTRINESVEIEIFFSRRKSIHNIDSANKNIMFSFKQGRLNDNDVIEFVWNMVYPQLVMMRVVTEDEITDIEKKDLSIEIFKEVIKYSDNINELMNTVNSISEEVDFGILNDLFFVCKNCKEQNELKLSNTINASMYSVHASTEEKKNTNYFYLIDSKLITWSEFCQMPIYMSNTLLGQINEIVSKKVPSKFQEYTPGMI